MNIKILRKLARTSNYQLIYSMAKEVGTLKIFHNTVDFTVSQIHFLHWLSVYSSLYLDLAMNKEYISEEVIVDDIRTDAYLLYRNEEDKKQSKKQKTPDAPNLTGVPKVIFTKKK